MDLIVGKKYENPVRAGQTRTIEKIDGDIITYRIEGALAFALFRAFRNDFASWARGDSPHNSTIVPPTDMPTELWNRAVQIIAEWEDEGGDPSDLAIALFELLRR